MSLEHPAYWLAYVPESTETGPAVITADAPAVLPRERLSVDTRGLLAAADAFHVHHPCQHVVFAGAVTRARRPSSRLERSWMRSFRFYRDDLDEPRITKGAMVSATVLYMSMSIDGFIAGPNAGPGNGLGDGGERLHDWMALDEPHHSSGVPGRPPGVNGQVFDEFMGTGGVVAGAGTFEPADGWGGDHHDGVPIFIYSRREPGIDISHWPLVTYVDDVTTAMTKAKQAAGHRNVLVHGAAVAQLALAAGLLDELELHVVPVLLGQGRRLFENLAAEQIELERTRVLEGNGVTHLHYVVRR